MPLAMDPSATFPVVLPSDRGKSPTPTFWYRHLSARKSRQIETDWLNLREGADPARAWPVILEAATAGLVGWENMTDEKGKKVPFDPERLPDLCTDGEIALLIGLVLQARRPGTDDLKNFGLPSPSSTGASDDAGPAAG